MKADPKLDPFTLRALALDELKEAETLEDYARRAKYDDGRDRLERRAEGRRNRAKQLRALATRVEKKRGQR